MRYIFLGLLFFATILKADEAGFDVAITPSASRISIKDTLEVVLNLTFPSGYQVDVEALRQNVMRNSSFYENSFSIADMKITSSQKNDEGTISQQIEIVLQPLRIGQVFLTFYDISFVPQDKKNKTHKFISPIFPIHILPVAAPEQFQGRLESLLTFSKNFPLELDEQNQKYLIEDSQVQKREEKINEEQMNAKRLPWIQVGSALLIIFIIWLFIKYPPVKPSLTPEQIAQAAKKRALTNLEKLKVKNLPEKGFFDEFYVELTQPVRAYIEKRYHVAAPTSTTSEFLADTVHNPAFPEQTRKLLAQFLYQADKVKFGRYKPSIQESRQALEQAIQFIKSDKL